MMESIIRQRRIGCNKCILFIALLGSCMGLLQGDQLAWNSEETCRRALDELPTGTLLISFCSACLEPQYVEIWRIQNAWIQPVGTESFCQLFISYEKLRRSATPVEGERLPDSIAFESFPAAKGKQSDRFGSSGIDLAYVYVPGQNGRFICLGRKLKLYCEVPVVEINLPRSLLEELEHNNKGIAIRR